MGGGQGWRVRTEWWWCLPEGGREGRERRGAGTGWLFLFPDTYPPLYLCAVPLRAGDAGVEMGFLDAVFSFLFGDGPPGPSDDERWQTVAALVRRQDGVVLAEEVLPLLCEAGEADEPDEEKW